MNVMYGYTSAGWTGKMPCREIGDAIVGTAKIILNQAMKKIEEMDSNYQVIYGDTDSIFVLMKNQTIDESLKKG